MKVHVPRKKKKQAKKLKSAADALVICQAVMMSAQSMMQIALITSRPIQSPAEIALKAVSATQVVINSTQAISKVMSQIKPWYEHVHNYKPVNSLKNSLN